MPTVDNDGCVLCPDCQTQVRTGNGGVQNFLQWHCGTAQCAANKKKKEIHDGLKAKKNAKKWFEPHVHIVPPTVSTPALVTPEPLPSSSSGLINAYSNQVNSFQFSRTWTTNHRNSCIGIGIAYH